MSHSHQRGILEPPPPRRKNTERPHGRNAKGFDGPQRSKRRWTYDPFRAPLCFCRYMAHCAPRFGCWGAAGVGVFGRGRATSDGTRSLLRAHRCNSEIAAKRPACFSRIALTYDSSRNKFKATCEHPARGTHNVRGTLIVSVSRRFSPTIFLGRPPRRKAQDESHGAYVRCDAQTASLQANSAEAGTRRKHKSSRSNAGRMDGPPRCRRSSQCAHLRLGGRGKMRPGANPTTAEHAPIATTSMPTE